MPTTAVVLWVSIALVLAAGAVSITLHHMQQRPIPISGASDINTSLRDFTTQVKTSGHP
ncbi:hypothetical protein AA0112_g5439 [Alternaria arborescens]|uniref:hypothetical protein n=1 Tax=Alternaria arborescens TaxID=156630 RepID=UPI0010750BF7|nr:hypothetical protein AA0111_g3337 [Alternaria arborescens]RYN34661.1 hypothetical protein AA0112_g5439 [Alternaria arborescens]RYO34841.1 hypothetical protein AA0111_g3337 [Alternaria arborescens]